jgi:hypothetical protein
VKPANSRRARIMTLDRHHAPHSVTSPMRAHAESRSRLGWDHGITVTVHITCCGHVASAPTLFRGMAIGGSGAMRRGAEGGSGLTPSKRRNRRSGAVG